MNCMTILLLYEKEQPLRQYCHAVYNEIIDFTKDGTAQHVQNIF